MVSRVAILGGIFGDIAGAILGGFSWTVKLASSFILNTLGGLVSMLIPKSWASEGAQIMQWIVTLPNYAGRVTAPGGGTMYGFASVNTIRDLMVWVGMALLPLTLMHGAGRVLISERESLFGPVSRVVGVAALLVGYTYWWAAGCEIVNSITGMIVGVPAVTSGLHRLMEYAVGGVALDGWQLIDLALMAGIAVLLLGLIFMKMALVIYGALLYVTGPLTLGLVGTEGGAVAARAWVSMLAIFMGLPVLWCLALAVGAAIINDAPTAGVLIAGSSSLGGLAGGLLLVVAGVAGLWVCIKIAKHAPGLLRVQLGGLRAAGGFRGEQAAQVSSVARESTSARTIRQFGQRVSRAAGAMGGELAQSGALGAATVHATSAVGSVGRRGLVGTATVGAQRGMGAIGSRVSARVRAPRAGAVAASMVRAGVASWRQPADSAAHPAADVARRFGQRGGKADFVGSGGTRAGKGGEHFESGPPVGQSGRHSATGDAADRASSLAGDRRNGSANTGFVGSSGRRAGMARDHAGTPSDGKDFELGRWSGGDANAAAGRVANVASNGHDASQAAARVAAAVGAQPRTPPPARADDVRRRQAQEQQRRQPKPNDKPRVPYRRKKP